MLCNDIPSYNFSEFQEQTILNYLVTTHQSCQKDVAPNSPITENVIYFAVTDVYVVNRHTLGVYRVSGETFNAEAIMLAPPWKAVPSN